MTDIQKMKQRKHPFPTNIPFTKTNLLAEAERIHALGLDEVEYSCASERGLRALIYRSRMIVLGSRFSFRNRPCRIRLGELGLITLEQARQQHRAYRLQASQGEDPRVPRRTQIRYSDLHEHYLVQGRSRGKKTIHSDISRHANWIGPEFDDMLVADINKSHINRFVLKMQAAEKAPSTIRTIVGQISTALELGVELDFIPRNVAKGVRLPRVNNQRSEFLTVLQIVAFMNAAQASNRLIGSRKLMLMALTGARLGEACKAEWQHIDLDAGIWYLPDQKSGRPGIIYLSEPAKSVIREMLAVRRNQYVFPGERDNDRAGRPIRPFRAICKQAGIPEGFRIHDLRHAWCSAGVYAGIPLEIISQGARHSTPGVTRRYSHAHQESLVAAQATIGALFMPTVEA